MRRISSIAFVALVDHENNWLWQQSIRERGFVGRNSNLDRWLPSMSWPTSRTELLE